MKKLKDKQDLINECELIDAMGHYRRILNVLNKVSTAKRGFEIDLPDNDKYPYSPEFEATVMVDLDKYIKDFPMVAVIKQVRISKVLFYIQSYLNLYNYFKNKHGNSYHIYLQHVWLEPEPTPVHSIDQSVGFLFISKLKPYIFTANINAAHLDNNVSALVNIYMSIDMQDRIAGLGGYFMSSANNSYSSPGTHHYQQSYKTQTVYDCITKTEKRIRSIISEAQKFNYTEDQLFDIFSTVNKGSYLHDRLKVTNT